jgi:permuted papain-like amidase YaeF/Yiix C92 family enzyme
MRRLLGAAVIALVACNATPIPSVKTGDIVFQTSRSSQSQAIQKATHSPFSHMGVVFIRGGRPYVFEAIATVRYTPLAQWLDRGEGGHYVIKRLRDSEALLTEQGISKLGTVAASFESRPYDLSFQWSDDRLYCSELVWKMYHSAVGVDLGRLQKLGEFDLSDPVVATKLHERYGDHVPLSEPVISPAAMFDSEELVTVSQR